MKIVSIIIPVYRTEKYLRQCLDSVLAQTYKNIEVIVVDDGSPDGSGQICDEYSSEHQNIVVIHKENEGLSIARNDGIVKSTGEYLFFLDSDDYISPTCIETLVTSAEKGFLSVIGYQLDIEAESRIYTPKQAYGVYNTIIDYYYDFANLFATKYNFSWGKLYRSDIIKNNGLRFNQSMALVEDVVFNQDYYKYWDEGIELVNDNGYYYRQHGSSTLSKAFNPKMFEWNEYAYNAIRKRLIESGTYTDKNKRHFLSNVLGNYLYSFRLLALNDNVPTAKKMEYMAIYSRSGVYKEAVSEMSQSRRVDDRMFINLIGHGQFSFYFFLESLKYKIRH